MTSREGRPSSPAAWVEGEGNTAASFWERGEKTQRAGLSAPETHWHQEGAAAASKEARVGGSSELRHGRYQVALGGGGTCVITLRAEGT